MKQMKMNDVSNRINEMLYEHKWYKRFTAITIVMSMLCTFYVPLDLIRPGMAAEGDSSTSQTTPGNTWFDDVQTSPLGDNLSEKLKGITIISGGKKYSTSPIIIDAGTVDPFLFDVALDYNYSGEQLGASGILNSHCVYYQIPPNTVTINQSYFGKEMIVTDDDWNNEVPSGYYSISTDGLIVIRFTDDYISYLEKSPNGFSGKIAFKAKAERDDSEDGDRTFTLLGTEVQIKFDDDVLSMSKDGSTGRDENGSYVQWNITIDNPKGHINLAEYILTDEITESGTAVDLTDSSKIFDVIVNPPDAATLSETGFTLSGNAQQVTINYKERAESGKEYNNTATLEKEGKTPVVKEKTVKIENKLEAYKTGTPDYMLAGEGEGKKVRWTIDVRNKSGDSLDKTKITDNNMSFPEDATTIYYFDSNNQPVKLESGYTITDNIIELTGESIPSHVQIVFDTELTQDFDENGKITIANSAEVESTKTDNPPDGDDDNSCTVEYVHQYRMSKSCSVFDTENDLLQWKIEAWAGDGNGSATLNGYKITDEAIKNMVYDDNKPNGNRLSFNAFTGGSSNTNITESVELVKEANSNIVTVRFKEGATVVPITKVEIFYQQAIADNVDANTLNAYNSGERIEVSNDATGQMPGTDVIESVRGTRKEQKQVKSQKSYLSSSNDKVIGNADQQDRILEWKVMLRNDSGFDGAKAATDVLVSDNGGSHYIKPSQAADIVLRGRVTESGEETVIPSNCYSITFYDENGDVISDFANGNVNAVKFVVNFNSDMAATKIHHVFITYKSTADVTGVTNGSIAHYNNEFEYEGEPKTTNGLTFEREDPNDVKNIKLFVKKKWEDRNNKYNTRPGTYTVQVWQAEADENGLAPAADAEGVWTQVGDDYVIDSSNTSDQLLGDEFPQWVVHTENGVESITRYCYKIVEVPDNESGYYVNNISNPIVANYDTTFQLENKKDLDVMKFAVNKNGSEIQEIDLSQVPKEKLNIGGTETECYIFSWIIYFKEGKTKYIDTLPTGATYINITDLNNDPLKAYAARAIYQDDGAYWNLASGWEIVNISVAGNQMTMEIKDTRTKALQYYTAIPTNQLDVALQSGMLINSVRIDGEENEHQAALTVNKDTADDTKHITKGSINVITGGVAKYYMDINPTGKKLSNDDYITITDELKLNPESDNINGLKIVLDDIKVYPYENGVVNKMNPIQDFSYTVDYDVTEEKQMSVVKEYDKGESQNHSKWAVSGWESGDEITVSIEQIDNVHLNGAYVSVVHHVVQSEWYEYDDTTNYQFGAYSNGKSEVTFTVPSDTSSISIIDYGYEGVSVKSGTATSVKKKPVVLNVDVPDQQHVRVEYTYRVTGYTPNTSEDPNNPNGSKVFFDNKASFNSDNGSGWDEANHVSLNVQSSNATSEATKFPKIYKVDVNNYSLNTLDASFKVAKWDNTNGKWVYASNVENTVVNNKTIRSLTFPDSGNEETITAGEHYAPTGSNVAVLKVASEDDPLTENDSENIHEFNLDNATLYKFVEIEAPGEYIQPEANASLETNKQFVYYYAYNGYDGTIPDDAKDENGRSKIRNIVVNGTVNIPNSKYVTLKAQKVFTGKEEDIPDTASVTLKLYYSTSRNKTNLKEVTPSMVEEAKRAEFSNPITLTYNKEPLYEPIAQWEGLTSGINGTPVYYFIQEEIVEYGGTTYTLDEQSEKLMAGEEPCQFQPVYTRNGTNKDGTVVSVNNSEGILVRKQWLNASGRKVNPPKDVNSDESMAIGFEVYGLIGNYRLKLDLTEEQSTLNTNNGYKLLIPNPVGLTGVTSQSVKNAIGYTDGKQYNLSEFDNFEIVEKLTAAQIQELYGKFGNPQSTRMISNGTGILELINTDLRSDTVDVNVEKKWDDNNKNHTADSVSVTLVQSTNSSLTSDDLNNIASGNNIEKDYRVGNDIRSTSNAVVGVKNTALSIQFASESSIANVTFEDEGWSSSFLDKTVAVAGHNPGKTVMTVTFTDGSVQQRIISVIDSYTATLNTDNGWKAEWNDLPAIADDGGSYYYYVIEDSVPTGYDVVYSKTATSDGQSIEVKNILPANLTVSKKWYDGNGDLISDAASNSALPDKITVEVYQRLLTEEEITGEDVPKPINYKVVALGDSITLGSFNGVEQQYRYPERLQTKLLNGGFTSASVLNYGVNSNEIDDMRSRLSGIDFTGVNAVALLAGTNDLLHGKSEGAVDRYQQLVEEIFAKAAAAGTKNFKIYAATIPYCTKLEWFPSGTTQSQANALVNNFNTGITNLINGSTITIPEGYGIVKVDANSVVNVIDQSGNELDASEIMLADQCHPNAKGYEEIAKAFYQSILSQYTTVTITTVTNPTDVDLPNTDYNINNLASGTLYGTYDITKANNYSLVLKNLPRTDVIGVQYVYYIKEIGTHVLNGDSYRLSENSYRYIEGVQYDNNGMTALTDDSMTISNTIKTTDLNIEKEWSDGNEKHENDEITVRIHRDTVGDSAAAKHNQLTLTLNKSEITLYKDSTVSSHLTATVPVKPVTSDKVNISLDVSKTHITMTPIAGTDEGDYNITFESEDGQTVDLTVHIIDKPELTLVLDKYELKGGDAAPTVSGVFTILDENVKTEAAYESSNSDVIEIDPATGEMIVKGIGTVTITASYDGKSASKNVTVSYSDDFSVTSPLNMTENQTALLSDNPLGIAPFIGEFTYTISQTNDSPSDGLTISDGTLTASKAGTYTVTVTRGDGKTHDVSVSVVKVTKDGTMPLTNSPNQEVTYSYDETTGIITITVPQNINQYDSSHKFNSIATNNDLKDLIPTKYELITSAATNEVSLYCAGNGWTVYSGSYSANTPIEMTASGNESFEQRKNSGNIDMGFNCSNNAGPYTLKIYVKTDESGGNEQQSYDSGTKTVDQAFAYTGWGNDYKLSLSETASIQAGSSVKLNLSGGIQGETIQIALTEGGEDYTGFGNAEATFDSNGNAIMTINVSNDKTLSRLDLWHYCDNTPSERANVKLDSYTITPPNTANANSVNKAPKLTRFTATSLRMSTAKILAAGLVSTPAETPVTITPQEQQSMEEHGYFDRTISAGDNWKITLSELPQYFVKADGTVASYYYWAEEISGADGYKVSYSFTDADDATSYSINASNSGSGTIRIKNTLNQISEPTTLPEAGGSGASIYYITGALLMLLTAAGYTMFKRRRWLSE